MGGGREACLGDTSVGFDNVYSLTHEDHYACAQTSLGILERTKIHPTPTLVPPILHVNEIAGTYKTSAHSSICKNGTEFPPSTIPRNY